MAEWILHPTLSGLMEVANRADRGEPVERHVIELLRHLPRHGFEDGGQTVFTENEWALATRVCDFLSLATFEERDGVQVLQSKQTPELVTPGVGRIGLNLASGTVELELDG